MRRILWEEKKSPNLARSEVIYVLTKKDNNIAKNGESRPINIIIIINYYYYYYYY